MNGRKGGGKKISDQDSAGVPPCGGFPGASKWEETPERPGNDRKNYISSLNECILT